MRKCKACYDTGYITTLDTFFDKNSIGRCDNCNRYSSDYLAQRAEIRERERIITYDQWQRLYRPLLDGDWYKDFHPYQQLSIDDKAIFDQAKTERRLWTETAEGDTFTVTPDIALCNRVAFYITEKPCCLNIIVEDELNVLELKVSENDAKTLLLNLDQDYYPLEDILSEKSCYLDVPTVDDHRHSVETLCKKYHRKIADAIELRW